MGKFTPVLAVVAALSVSAISGVTAYASEEDNMCAEISAAIQSSGSNVCVTMDDGVATLSGYVESALDKQAAEQAAKKMEGVTEVISRITVSN